VASIPFRFKSGGSGNNMAPIAAQSHHHRSTTKKDKKGFKSRHATKGALKEQSKGASFTTTRPDFADCVV
jgi:pre-rRNA-processing protein TSR1